MSLQRKDLYKILELKQDCTPQEIKTAFIRLSKKFHPDVNKDPGTQIKFQQINEAYSILSKSSSRYKYDQGGFSDNNFTAQYDIYRRRAGESFWENRAKYDQPFAERPYYSIKGLKKVSNTVIVLLCLVITFTGAGLQYFAITKSFTFSRDRMNLESAKNSAILKEARKQAFEIGNEEQIRRFEKGIPFGEKLPETQPRVAKEN